MSDSNPNEPADTQERYGSAQKVWDTTERMQRIENLRALDRALINNLFNGQRPYSKEEESKFNIQINVNWGEGKRIMADANRQLNNALLHPGTLFQCTLEEGPVDKRDEWSQEFTKNIHIPLQRGESGLKFGYTQRESNASTAMHGLGPCLWPNDYEAMPRYVAVEDLLIPTDTYCSFTNLGEFAVNFYLTAGEFIDMTKGDRKQKGWNQEYINTTLDNVVKMGPNGSMSTWRNQPEAMYELFKQNKGWYYSDIPPKIKLRYFFFKDSDDGKWYRHVILRETIGEAQSNEFVYNGSGKPFADKIGHILNVQYGDVNLVAPFKYHSVRGLGVDLYAPVEVTNRLRCQFIQSVFEHLLMYFRIQDPTDRDRLKQVVLQGFGFLPEGLSIVPRDDRHQIDPNMVAQGLGQIREIMAESSSAFVKDLNDGSEKEMTAQEANIRLNQANVMVGSMLMMLYIQKTFFYEEIVRRFLKKNSGDESVKIFHKACKDAGIPDEYMVADKWRVVPERVLGGGDKTLAQGQAQWLLQNINMYDPQSQQKIKRLVTSTMLDDPAKGLLYVPSAPVTATDGALAANYVFGTLMQGTPVEIQEGIDQIGFVTSMLKMMGAVIQRVSSTDNVGTPGDIIGLMTAMQNCGQHLMILAADPTQNQNVKQLGDALKQQMYAVKAFAQRQQQAQEAAQQNGQAQLDPKDAAKIAATGAIAQQKLQLNEAKSKQKQQQQIVQFQMEQNRANLEALAEINRTNLASKQKIWNESLQNTIDTMRQLSQPQSNGSNGD